MSKSNIQTIAFPIVSRMKEMFSAKRPAPTAIPTNSAPRQLSAPAASQNFRLTLSDETYKQLTEAAAATGETPSNIIIKALGAFGARPKVFGSSYIQLEFIGNAQANFLKLMEKHDSNADLTMQKIIGDYHHKSVPATAEA